MHDTELTHAMPAPPSGLLINGVPLPDECDEAMAPMVSEGPAGFSLTWVPVMMTHPTLGSPHGSTEIDIDLYQVFVDQDDFGLAVDRDPAMTNLTIPAGTLTDALTLIEVLVREGSHNQTATETCFVARRTVGPGG